MKSFFGGKNTISEFSIIFYGRNSSNSFKHLSVDLHQSRSQELLSLSFLFGRNWFSHRSPSVKSYRRVDAKSFIASLLRILEYRKFPRTTAVSAMNIASWFWTSRDDWNVADLKYEAPWFSLRARAWFAVRSPCSAVNGWFVLEEPLRCALES